MSTLLHLLSDFQNIYLLDVIALAKSKVKAVIRISKRTSVEVKLNQI